MLEGIASGHCLFTDRNKNLFSSPHFSRAKSHSEDYTGSLPMYTCPKTATCVGNSSSMVNIPSSVNNWSYLRPDPRPAPGTTLVSSTGNSVTLTPQSSPASDATCVLCHNGVGESEPTPHASHLEKNECSRWETCVSQGAEPSRNGRDQSFMPMRSLPEECDDQYIRRLLKSHSELTNHLNTMNKKLLSLLYEEWALTGKVPEGYDDLRAELGENVKPLKNTSFPLPRVILQRASTLSRTPDSLTRQDMSELGYDTIRWPRTPGSRCSATPECSPRKFSGSLVHKRHESDSATSHSRHFQPLPDVARRLLSAFGQTESLGSPSLSASCVDGHTEEQSNTLPMQTKLHSPRTVATDVFSFSTNESVASPSVMCKIDGYDPTRLAYSPANSQSIAEDISSLDEDEDIERLSCELQLRRLEVDYAVVSQLYTVHKQRAAETKRDAYKVAYRSNARKLKEISSQIEELKAHLNPSVSLTDSTSGSCHHRRTWNPLRLPAANWTLTTLPRRTLRPSSPAPPVTTEDGYFSTPTTPGRWADANFSPKKPPPSLASRSASPSSRASSVTTDCTRSTSGKRSKHKSSGRASLVPLIHFLQRHNMKSKSDCASFTENTVLSNSSAKLDSLDRRNRSRGAILTSRSLIPRIRLSLRSHRRPASKTAVNSFVKAVDTQADQLATPGNDENTLNELESVVEKSPASDYVEDASNCRASFKTSLSNSTSATTHSIINIRPNWSSTRGLVTVRRTKLRRSASTGACSTSGHTQLDSFLLTKHSGSATHISLIHRHAYSHSAPGLGKMKHSTSRPGKSWHSLPGHAHVGTINMHTRRSLMSEPTVHALTKFRCGHVSSVCQLAESNCSLRLCPSFSSNTTSGFHTSSSCRPTRAHTSNASATSSSNWSTSGCSCLSSQTAESSAACETIPDGSSKECTFSTYDLKCNRRNQKTTPINGFVETELPNKCNEDGNHHQSVQLRTGSDRGRRTPCAPIDHLAVVPGHVKCICSCLSEQGLNPSTDQDSTRDAYERKNDFSFRIPQIPDYGQFARNYSPASVLTTVHPHLSDAGLSKIKGIDPIRIYPECGHRSPSSSTKMGSSENESQLNTCDEYSDSVSPLNVRKLHKKSGSLRRKSLRPLQLLRRAVSRVSSSVDRANSPDPVRCDSGGPAFLPPLLSDESTSAPRILSSKKRSISKPTVPVSDHYYQFTQSSSVSLPPQSYAIARRLSSRFLWPRKLRYSARASRHPC
ncbi:unnamed protein product [Calicophoron daubneyi]|uniref:Uncharacterized protein n=1 Tax=Calicophoron daubneyi TaxID=300641 RepID=A0AAV2TEF0_CALDB